MYVDGYVLPVRRDRIEEYRRMADHVAAVWIEKGALTYVECAADDVPEGEVTSFPRAVALRPDETVVFAWITFRDRAHRDAVNAAAMEVLAAEGMDDMPFDMQRMVFGGFKAVVQRP